MNTYLAKLKSHFPDISFEAANLVTKGWDHDVVILDDRLVFRFPKSEGYLGRLGAEIRLAQHLVPKMPVAIPDYIYVAEEFAFGGYEMLPGVEMQADVFRRLDGEARETIARQIGQFLSVLHGLPAACLQEFGFEAAAGGPCWSKPHAEEVLIFLKDKVFSLLASKEAAFIEQQFTDYLTLTCDLAPVPIHRDLTGDHILSDSTQGVVTGVIDFADAEVSDPALDFFGLWTYGEDFVHAVLGHYEGEVDKDFLARSRFPNVMNVAGYMARLESGEPLPVTFDELREELAGVMRSGLRV